MATITTIAACLMVRNEAAFLHACLTSLEGQVDAIYVTDTGSTDDSLRVAKSFGANVRSFQWINDFAAARNASIAGITEDWILTLDADDLFPAGEAGRLRAQLQTKACAATLRYAVVPDYTPVRAIKLLRNGLGVTFEGSIHENAYEWLAARRAEGWQQQDLDVTLIHTGYTPGAMPGKVLRNLPLLQGEWERGQGRGTADRQFYIGAELGLALAYADRKSEAREFLERLLAEVTSPERVSVVPSSLQVLINLLWVLKGEEQNDAALEIVRRVEPCFAVAPAYQLHRGLAELASLNYAAARVWLERFRESGSDREFDVPVPMECLGAGWWRSLGLCYMGEREFARAADCFRRCSELEPGNEEHKLRLLVAERMMSQ